MPPFLRHVLPLAKGGRKSGGPPPPPPPIDVREVSEVDEERSSVWLGSDAPLDRDLVEEMLSNKLRSYSRKDLLGDDLRKILVSRKRRSDNAYRELRDLTDFEIDAGTLGAFSTNSLKISESVIIRDP